MYSLVSSDEFWLLSDVVVLGCRSQLSRFLSTPLSLPCGCECSLLPETEPLCSQRIYSSGFGEGHEHSSVCQGALDTNCRSNISERYKVCVTTVLVSLVSKLLLRGRRHRCRGPGSCHS